MRRQQDSPSSLNNRGESHLVFKFDQNIISPFTIQEAYDKAKNNSEKYKALQKIFSFIKLLRDNKTNPNNEQNRNQIRQALQNKIVLPFIQDVKPKFVSFNIQKVYAMNKDAGERKGRFVDKGVMQFEDKKQEKLKQIKSFINVIQQVGNKSTLTKIPWLKDTKRYPYRMILIDKNKADKCVYFQSLQQAQTVQIYLIEKYKLKLGSESVKRIMNSFSSRWKNMHLQSFKKCLTQKMKSRQESEKERAKYNIKGERSQAKKYFQVQEQNNLENSESNDFSSDFNKNNRKSQTKTQNIYFDKDQEFGNKKQIQENIDAYSTKKFKKKKNRYQNEQQKVAPLPAFYKIQTDYIRSMIDQWKSKAVKQRQLALEKKLQQDRQNARAKKNASKSISGAQSSIVKYSLGQTLDFISIEFLEEISTLFKPIIQISLFRDKQKDFTQIFNTMLMKKQPTLTYKLIAQKPSKIPFELQGYIKEYDLQIKVADFFSGQQIYKQKIILGSKIINQKLIIVSTLKTLFKLQCKYSNKKIRKAEQEKLFSSNLDNFIQQLPEEEEQNQQEYNFDQQDLEDVRIQLPQLKIQHKNLLKNKALSFKQPLYCFLQQALGTSQEEYNILLKVANVCLQLRIEVTENFLSFLRLLKQSQLFNDLNEITQATLSIVINWYYQLWNNQGAFYEKIGFQNDQIDKPDEKMMVMAKIFQEIMLKQSQELYTKLLRKNTPIKILFLQYCHNLFSKNFPCQVCLALNSYIFSKQGKQRNQIDIQAYYILLMVWLCQYFDQELKKTYNIKQARDVLQSKNTTLFNQKQIMKDIINLYEKYFTLPQKNQKNNKQKTSQLNFQAITYWFYEIQSKRLDQNKLHRHIEKKGLVKSFHQGKENKQISKIEIPYYKAKSFCLHIIFTSLPKTSGSLYLKCFDVEYRLQNYQKNPYFILPSVNSSITVQFIDSKSNQYSFELELIKGFDFFQKKLTNSKGVKFEFQYWAGLFTQQELQNLKNANSVQNSLCSLLKIDELKYNFQREFSISKIYQQITTKFSLILNPDLINKLKIAFSQYQNKLNQYELFMYILAGSSISVKEKIYMIYEYCSALSNQYFLCQNHILERMMIWDLIKLLEFPIERQEFQAYYQNWLKCQIHSSKVFKARFFTNVSHKQVKLQAQLNKYLANRAKTYVYSDIDLQQLLSYLKESIQKQLGQLSQGVLKLVVSTNGTVKDYNFNVVLKNHNKDLSIDQNSYLIFKNIQTQRFLQKLQPVLLKSEVDPNIARGSSLLSLSRKKLNLEDSRLNDNQIFQAPLVQVQKINLVKFILKRFKKIIPMRYKQYPKEVIVPFLQDFCKIVTKQFLNKEIKIQKFFQNGEQISPYQLFCNQQNKLKFSQNQNSEIYDYDPAIGIQNNLRKLLLSSAPLSGSNKNTSIKHVHFFTYPKDQLNYPIGRVFVNYGRGVFRWQRCQIKGYLDDYLKQENNDKKKNKNKKQAKKYFLVQISNGQQVIIQQKYIKLPQRAKFNIQKLDFKSVSQLKTITIRI